MGLSTAAHDEIEQLQKKYPSTFSAALVLKFAKNKDSALHSAFEWNDGRAAERYRLLQAAQLIRLYVVVRQEEKPPTRGFVSLIQDRDYTAKKAGRGLRRHIDDVMDDESLKANYIETVLMELRALKRKYEQIVELAAVWNAIDQVDQQLKPIRTPAPMEARV